MKQLKYILGLIIFIFFVKPASANDSVCIKVLFLYGSKPKHAYKDIEPKWFGGIYGGHVGIEIDSNIIIDFIRNGKFHYFSHRNNYHGKFVFHNQKTFWELFGGSADSVKKLVISIPIKTEQKHLLDSLATAYTAQSPYDYAFVGMRCGAAAYDILSQIGFFKKSCWQKKALMIFYPRQLRKKLLKKAKTNSWIIDRREGSFRRKWEKD